MARAITNLTQIGLIAEVTPGTTPATPALQKVRATSENFDVLRNFTTSEEFNPVAQEVDQILVSNRAQGGFSFEWADNEPGIETCLESTMWGAWSTDTLLAGITGKPLTIETKHEAGATDQYRLLTGMYGNEFSLDFAASAKITGSFGFVGMTSTLTQSAISGATYPAVGTEPVSVTGDMAISSTGLTVDAVTKLSIKLVNNCRVHAVLGNFNPTAVQKGTTEVTGEIELYLNTGTIDWATKYLTNASFTIVATAGSTTLKKTVFTIPVAKFTSLKVMSEGNNQDVMIRGQWKAFYSSGTGSLMSVARNVA